MGNANRVPLDVLEKATGQSQGQSQGQGQGQGPNIQIVYTQDESNMRAMYKARANAFSRINFRRGSYLLESYQEVALKSTEPIPSKVGVGLVAGKMKYDWIGQVGIVESLQRNYGPNKIRFHCVWFDADNPLEHPDDALLKYDRRFAVINSRGTLVPHRA